jgi:hypothetical protein
VTSTFVAADTGVLLAQAFGPEVDPQASRALQALEQAAAAGVPVLLLPSVDAELDKKLGELDEIHALVREAYRRLSEERPTDSGLAAAESLVLEVRRAAAGKVPRILASFEAEFVRRVLAMPTAPVSALLGDVAARFGLRAEAIRWATRSGHLESAGELEPDEGEGPASIQGVDRLDLVHLRACQLLARVRGGRVVFLTLDEKLYAAKPEVELTLSLVRLTTPEYLTLYLEP